MSTDNEEQAGSYETQVTHYREYITANPEWVFVDVYADEGISATNTKKRDDFNRMIDDCKKGLIDLILTKSISRFARNTVDCLNYIRILKEMNIPVFFEKENINSMDAKGEVLLTIMASLAQQESESLSKNVKLGMQYRFQNGEVMVNAKCFLGYDKDEDGNLVINPQEAEIVKRIFLEYLEGASCQKIAKGLMRDGILTSRGNPRWHDSSIRLILENEKYMGDALLQKTYTVDFLNKKRIKNNGIMPKYYIEDHHEAIIPKELFMRVQEEIARRSSERDLQGRRKGFSAAHAFSQIVFCADCGEEYHRIHWNNRGKKSIVWRCSTRLKDKDKCRARTVNEEVLHSAFLDAVNEMLTNSTDYLTRLKTNLDTVLGTDASDEELNAKMAALQQELLDRTERRENYDDVATEILRLREIQAQNNMDNATRSQHKKRIKELQKFIKTQSTAVSNFDEALAKKLLAKIIIHEDYLEFTFKSGVTVSIEK
ncbi:MAG: recombinase family protein [Ruminococcus sp.]|nr:recombinase family protein [Ruminococcus sp.]